MLLGQMLHEVRAFDVPRWSTSFSEVDQTCAFGARDVQLETQRFRLSIGIHGSVTYRGFCPPS